MAGGSSKNGEAAFIAALATGATVEAAAVTAGVSESTAYRWLRGVDFQERLREARSALVREAVGKLSGKLTKATDTLEQPLSAESEAVRLGAARSIIELGAKLREQTELEERLRALEDQADKNAES